ncbi:MAG: hypothetical protein ACPGU5_01155 [Lishizhenia sp.]
MNPFIKHSIRFILFVLLQGIVFSQLEIQLGVQIMLYPLYILLLPIEMGVIWVMLLSFFMGISIDFFMNTFGLHASAAVLIAYFRPELLKIFAPREGYEAFTEGNIKQMGYRWFISVFSVITLTHHLYFFLLEQFKLTEIFYILRQTVLSSVLTIIIAIVAQILFLKTKKIK